MAVEVGVGYVSVVPETRDFGRLLQQQISGETAQVGTTAGQQTGEGFLGGIGGKLKAGIVGVAAGAGALFATGFSKALDQEQATAKLGAQLGLTKAQSARAGKIAGSVYAKGYGESIDQVNDSLKSLQQNGVASIKAPQKELAGLSKSALNLAEVFDADVADSTKAVGQLIRTGLVKDGKQGFDLLTAGFQSGADKAGDLIDTVNEYSTQWRKAGLSGATAIGLINQGLKAGARDGDLVADSIKEFSIRAVDGSKTTAGGFKALGLNADSMAARFAKGGKTATGVLQVTLDKLRGIKDPVKQSQAAVALFGTQAEDLGQALYSLDPSKAAAGLGKVGGAADRMGKTMHDTASAKIEQFKRGAMQGLVTFIGGYVLPPLEKVGSVVTRVVAPAFGTVKRVVGGALSSLGHGGGLGPLTSALSTAGAVVHDTLAPAFSTLVGTVRGTLLPALSGLWSVVSGKLVPAIGRYLGTALSAVWGVLSKVGAIMIGTVWPAAMRVYSALADALGPIISSVASFIQDRAVPAVQMIGNKFGELVSRAQPVISVVATVLSWLGQMAAKVIGFVVPVLVNLIGPVFSGLFSVLGTAIGWLSSVVGAVVSFGQGVATVATDVASGFMWLWTNAVQPALGGIRTGLQAVGTAASWLWANVLSPVFSAIATGAKILFAVVAVIVIAPLILAFKALALVGSWLWTNALKPAFDGIASGATWLWQNAIKPAFDGIAAGAMWLWNNAIGPAFRGIMTVVGWFWTGVQVVFGWAKAGLRALGAVGLWLYRNAIQPAFRGIVAVVSWWWNGVEVVFGWFKAGLHAVGSAGSWLYHSAIKPAFDGISNAASWLYSHGIKPAFDAGKRAVGLLADAFGKAKDAIGRAFNKIIDLTKKPINFVIDMVYTHGIKAVWDKVAGFVGLSKLPAAPKLLAEGGRTRGGTPGKDSIPALMMADEYVVKRSSARAVGFGTLDYINQHGELPVQRFAGGGVVGKVAGWVGDKAKSIGSAVMDGVDFLAHPGRLWDKATKFVRDKLAQIGQNRFAQMIAHVPLKMLSSLKDKVVKAATSMFGGGAGDVGGAGVKRWSGVVLQALKLVGQPASLLPTVLRRMNQESGGNPRAINNWDINAKNGDPSRGLMQVIGATFRAYAGKLAGRGIYDPLANIYASMRYALARYGSLASAYNRAGGYASGGRPKAGELAWVGEQGPELVRFGSGGSTVYDHRTSLGMMAGLGALRGFAKGTRGAAVKARKELPGDLGSFTKSLKGSAGDISKASKSLADDLRKTGKAGKGLAAQVGVTSAKLQTLAKARDAVASKIETAKQAAADQRKSAADYVGLSSVGDVTSVGGLIAGMQQRQTSLANFQSLIKSAQKKGVSQSVIQQLVAAGPDSNLAQLVAGATAGDIKKINSLAASGAKLSTSYGNFMADAMYDSGVNAGKGFLTGLQSQEAALQAQMNKLGAGMVKAIKKELKIHSPSRVADAEVGQQVGAGVLVGMQRMIPHIDRASVDMARAAVPSVMPAAAAAQVQARADGLRRGDTLVVRIGEHEFRAVVDERVDAGLAAVRTRSRAGSKKG